MIPVAIWNDGTGNKYMRFTESWRSIVPNALAIPLAGLGYTSDNVPKDASELNDKAKALLTLIDYSYSKEGQILLSYGPDAFVDSSKTFELNGEQWPVISDKSAKFVWEQTDGDYTKYAQYYLGSQFCFIKSQGFEYQCTTDVGKEGAEYISKAIALGTVKHLELAVSNNSWYTCVPSILPTTGAEKYTINDAIKLYSEFSTANNGFNKLCDIISHGFTGQGFASVSDAVNTVSNQYGGTKVLEIYNAAWERLKSLN